LDTQGYADVNGTRLYFEVAGSGRQAVVLIHGFSLDTRMWDDQFEAFARHYRVLRYDARGYGRSALPGVEGHYHAEDLRALLDEVEISLAYLVGLSWGAAVAAEFVLAYPEMSGAWVAADPVLWGYEGWSEDYVRTLSGLEEAGREGGVEAARHLWLGSPLFAPALEKPKVAERLRLIVGDYSGWHWTHHDTGLLPEPPAAIRLEEIRVPTLTVVGERDMPDHIAIADEIARRVPGAGKVTLPGAGHMANMESPGDFNRAVLRFFAEVDAAG
jgi:3-oxoadipate enol-lactonase